MLSYLTLITAMQMLPSGTKVNFMYFKLVSVT